MAQKEWEKAVTAFSKAINLCPEKVRSVTGDQSLVLQNSIIVAAIGRIFLYDYALVLVTGICSSFLVVMGLTLLFLCISQFFHDCLVLLHLAIGRAVRQKGGSFPPAL